MAPKKVNLYQFPHPASNDFLVGHENTIAAFNNAWDKKDAHSIHPVWILSGPKGIGKATAAYQIAKRVYGDIGDFFIMDTDHNIDKDDNPKTDGKTISVFLARKIIRNMQMSSMSGGWRVVLIDSVDELSSSASNALLKLLEEPPEKTLFLLIVHKLSRVLPTIKSRARVEKMSPLTLAGLRQLCDRFITDDIGDKILQLSDGSFGKIADLKKTGGDKIYQELITVLENPKSNSADLMLIAKKIAPNPELHIILLDAIYHFGLADLYTTAARSITDTNTVHLEPEIAIFLIMNNIKKCL